MNGINAQRFERFDFSRGACGAQFDNVRSSNSRKDHQSREQRTEFAHDDDDHHGSEIVDCSQSRRPRNGLPDYQKPQRRREEQKHWHQPEARAGDFVKDQQAARHFAPRRISL